MKRIERVRLYPTLRQIDRLTFALDVTRELYNAALQERRDAYRRNKTRITAKQQYNELTGLRADDARIAAVYRECEDAVLHRLDLAFAAFFRRVKRGETPGYPRFKGRDRWAQLEFPHGDRALKFDCGQRRVRVPAVGWVKLRKGRKVPQGYGRAWIVRRCDSWYACFECERDVTPLESTGTIVGVDRGIAVLAALDDDTRIANRAPGDRNAAKVAAMQRKLESVTQRDARGHVLNRRDPRRRAVVLRLARAKAGEADARRDHAHKAARQIVNAADVIGLEALRLRHMTRSAKGTVQAPGRNVRAKAGLNRRMLDAGFGLRANCKAVQVLIGERSYDNNWFVGCLATVHAWRAIDTRERTGKRLSRPRQWERANMRPVTKVNPSRSLVKSSRTNMLGESGALVPPSVCRLREGQRSLTDYEPHEVKRELGVKGSGRMDSPERNSRDLYSLRSNPPHNQRYKDARRNPAEREVEKSEEAVVPVMTWTTQPGRREGPLLLSRFRGGRYRAIAKC